MMFAILKVFDWSNYFDITQPDPVSKKDNVHVEINSAEPLNVYVFDCTFSGTKSTTNGGAVFYMSKVEGSHFLAESCFFTQCTSDKKGGALYAYAGTAGVFSKLCFTKCNAKVSSQYASLVLSQTNKENRNEIYLFSCTGTQFLPSVSRRSLSAMQAFGKIVNKEHNISNTYLAKDAGITCITTSKSSSTFLNFENLTSDYTINVFSADDVEVYEIKIESSNMINCKPISPAGQYDDFGIILLEGEASINNCCFVNNVDNLIFQGFHEFNKSYIKCTSTVSNCIIVGDRSYSDCWKAEKGCSISFSGIKEEEATNTIICYKTADCEAKYDSTPEQQQKITVNQRKLSFLFYSICFVTFFIYY